MEITIKPDDIDQYVRTAILESTVGRDIKEGLERALKSIFSGYGNPIQDIMKRELERIVKDYLEQPDIKPKIYEAIAKAITPEAIETIVGFGVAELDRRHREYREC